jgi:protein-tyrosine phosphatase
MQALSQLNFRDLGGIPVDDGVIRAGRVYRSVGPASFDDIHRAELKALDFRIVCDLRSTPEKTAAPNDWAGGAQLLEFDIIADLRAQAAGTWEVMRANPNIEGARQTMIGTYQVMPAALKPHMARFIGALAGGDAPMMVHCTAGKDRTGVLSALLLHYLGAPDEAIRRDYLLSERFSRSPGAGASVAKMFEKTLGFAPDAETLQAMIGVDPRYIDAALAVVDADWGSVEAYFEDAGVGEAERSRLKAVLVEPA